MAPATSLGDEASRFLQVVTVRRGWVGIIRRTLESAEGDLGARGWSGDHLELFLGLIIPSSCSMGDSMQGDRTKEQG